MAKTKQVTVAGQLEGADYNPREITPERLANLQKAMDRFGDLSGIVFNIRTGKLIGGHQRMKHIPDDAAITIVQRYDKPTPRGTVALGHIILDGEAWTYREVDVDLTTEKQMNLTANEQGGEWDPILLAQVTKTLDEFNALELDVIGFDERDIAKLWADAGLDQVGTKFDIGYDGDADAGFAGGSQFGRVQEYAFEIIMPPDHPKLEEAKTRLGELGDQWGVTFRIRVMRAS